MHARDLKNGIALARLAGMERKRHSGVLCLDGRHSVRTTHTAAEGLRALPPELLAHISRMLCEIAEVAAIRLVTNRWDESSLLRLHAGHALVLYTLDSDANLIVHHVIDSGVEPARGTG